MHKLIRTDNMSGEQRMRFVEEAEAQGCRLRLAPAENIVIIHGSRRRAYLFYVVWDPEPRTIRQTRTLWPIPLPESWKSFGVPTRVVARPIRYPQRLINALTEAD